MPAAKGDVTFTGTVPKSVETGNAVAFVACGTDDLEAAPGHTS